MNGIQVSFGNLTKDQAEELIELYASFSGVGDLTYGDASVIGERGTANPLPAPQATELSHDQRGVPFHPDFHSSVRRLNDDGTWKLRRGVDKALAKAYNESFAASGTPAPTPAQLNQQFGAPPVPAAPAITVEQWQAKCLELYNSVPNKWTVEFVTGMNAACGIANQTEYSVTENSAARALSYQMMMAA